MIVDGGRILDQEAREERGRNLAAGGLNGLRRLFVRLLPPAAATEAWLDVELHNALQRDAIVGTLGERLQRGAGVVAGRQCLLQGDQALSKVCASNQLQPWEHVLQASTLISSHDRACSAAATTALRGECAGILSNVPTHLLPSARRSLAGSVTTPRLVMVTVAFISAD